MVLIPIQWHILIDYLPQLIDAGVDSFKVEGRTKSTYYVSCVAKTYREAIDEYVQKGTFNAEFYKNELWKVRNRGYTTGFFLDKSQKGNYTYAKEPSDIGNTFCIQILDKDEKGYKGLIKTMWIQPKHMNLFHHKTDFQQNCSKSKMNSAMNLNVQQQMTLSI